MDEARAFHPDVAILDIGMQGMNGFDLARAMREDAVLAKTKLIALTGWGTSKTARMPVKPVSMPT